MDNFFHILSNGADAFINLFRVGGETFINLAMDIIPMLISLLVVMNAVIALVGVGRFNKFAQKCSANVFTRYLVMPVFGTFLFCSPMTYSLGKFLPEKYKPSYFAATSYTCHTMNGLFPHINPSEVLVFMGIAAGITDLGLSSSELAIRYFLVGLLTNFLKGCVTDFTTEYVSKQQQVKLTQVVTLKQAVEM